MLSLCFLFFILFFVIPSKLKRIQCSKLASLFRVQRPNKGDKMARSMERLPQELVSNVLSRLPAKELLKCKCVCKSWFGLITDPHFVTNYHLAYNNLMHRCSQEEHLLIIQRPSISDLRTSISVLSWSSHDDPKNHDVSSVLLNPPEEYNSNHKYWSEIMGPCNGIYFLEGNPNVMMNPSLRQFKTLPESHFTAPHGTYSLTDYAGFGFDPKTNDYKVVVVKDLWLKETDERQIGRWNAELYSLNSNSWKKLDADASSLPLPVEIWGSSRVHTYVNNCCHWWGFETHESGKTEDVVLSFDMVNETFRKIRVPKLRESSEEAFATLAPFEDSSTIGVIVYPVRGSVKRFDVWVMRDYWDEGSWVKQYSVGPVEVIDKLVVVGFIGSNRFLWKCSDQEGLVLNDKHDTRKTRDLKVYGKFDSLRAAVYEESLVSLERRNEFSCQFVSQ